MEHIGKEPYQGRCGVTGKRVAALWLVCGIVSLAHGNGIPRRLGDEFTISRYGREEGMPEVAVQALGQSPDGFIWCLTLNHLLRFDGVAFRAFGDMDEEALLKPYPMLFRGWAVDDGGGAWVFGRRGAARRTPEGWHRLHGGEAWRPVIAMMPTDSGFQAVTEVAVLRVEEDRWVSKTTDPKPPKGMMIACAVADGAGGILLGGNLGVFHFNATGYQAVAGGHGATGNVSCVAAGSGNSWWACGIRGLFQGSESGVRHIPTPFPGEQASVMMVDAGDALWVGTHTGLFRWSEGEWSQLTQKDLATSLETTCLHRDRENHIWVGTADGLFCLRPKLVDVLFAKPREGRQPVSALTVDADGQLWAGSAGEGLLRVREGDLSPVEIPGMPDGIAVSSLAAAADGGLWVGTLRGGLIYRTADGGAVRAFSEAPGSSHRANEISSLRVESNRLYVGTRRGLFTMNPPGTGSPPASLDAALLRTESGVRSEFVNRVTALTGDGGNAVLAGYEGLWVVRHDFNSENRSGFGYGWGLPSPNVRSPNVRTFLRDHGGRLWAGTSHGLGLFADDGWFRALQENGLFVDDMQQRASARTAWDRQGKRMLWEKLTAAHGLANEDIRQIVEDREGRLWLGTRKGIQIFDRSVLLEVAEGRKPFAEGRLIGLAEGMASEECTLNSSPGAVMDKDGKLYFATTDGLVRADPDRIRAPQHPPPVFIDQVTAGAVIIYQRPEISPLSPAFRELAPMDEPTVVSGSGDVTFAFDSPSYDSPSRVLFRWRLDGVDSDWSAPSAERKAVYPRLPPGSYAIRAMAGGQGAWREAAAPFRFRIRPRWFEMPGVHAAAVFLGMAALATGIRTLERRRTALRTARRIESLKREGALERERARISRDLHDEMGVGLTEIGLLGDLTASAGQGESGGLATEISQRARGLAGALDEIVWAINPANDNSLSLGDYFSRYAQNLLLRAGIRCRLDVANDSLDASIDSERRHQLFRAFKEILNNVINHARASEVRIRIMERSGLLTIRVEDDGCGFDEPVGEGSPDGLRGMKERLAAINGACEIRSEPGLGTSVTLTLPKQTL